MLDWFVIAILALAAVCCVAGYWARMLREMGR